MLIKIILTRDKTPSLLARAIMLKDGTDYSHTAIIYTDRRGNDRVFQAKKGAKVGSYNFVNFLESNKIVKEYTVKIVKDGFYDFIKSVEGTDYGTWQMRAMAIGAVRKDGSKTMICSELVGLVLREFCAIDIKGSQDEWRPKHIEKALE